VQEAVQWDDYWNPKLYVENAIGELKSSSSRCVQYDVTGLATVSESQLISGTFFEFMELNKFPFDSQVSPYVQQSRLVVYSKVRKVNRTSV